MHRDRCAPGAQHRGELSRAEPGYRKNADAEPITRSLQIRL